MHYKNTFVNFKTKVLFFDETPINFCKILHHKMGNNLEKYIRLITSNTTPIKVKNRAIFYLRTLGTDEAALCLEKCITNNSVLLDHEIAYVLGQMGKQCSKPFLLELAKNEECNPIVRHEAIEALGNYGDKNIINDLLIYTDNEIPLIKESAILAIDKLKQKDQKISLFGSKDPAYPCESTDLTLLRDLFINGSLVEKYQSMFKLRDINTQTSVEILGEGFKDNSALLRHEVAYVFGQMENEHSVDILEAVLADKTEEDVVRHEAAEALGAIGSERCKKILEKYRNSSIQIIRESVEVGLEILDKDIDDYLDLSKIN